MPQPTSWPVISRSYGRAEQLRNFLVLKYLPSHASKDISVLPGPESIHSGHLQAMHSGKLDVVLSSTLVIFSLGFHRLLQSANQKPTTVCQDCTLRKGHRKQKICSWRKIVFGYAHGRYRPMIVRIKYNHGFVAEICGDSFGAGPRQSSNTSTRVGRDPVV